jgi:hypothetical protein
LQRRKKNKEMTKKKVVEQPKKVTPKVVVQSKKVAPPLKKAVVAKPATPKPKTIIWKDKTPIKTVKHDTSKSNATDSNEGYRSPVSPMRLERLSRKRKRIHSPRQPGRLLRASGKRGER